MTDAPANGADGAAAIRSLFRRAGHELRNAQSAAAVNLEVIRSRLSAGHGDAASLGVFSANAAKGLEESARLGESIIALCGALTVSLASGNSFASGKSGDAAEIELPMSGDSVDRWIADVRYLTDRAGLALERSAAGVILRIPPEHETN